MKTTWILGIFALLAVLGSATAHEHKAPHGGTLVVFGKEFKNVAFNFPKGNEDKNKF